MRRLGTGGRRAVTLAVASLVHGSAAHAAFERPAVGPERAALAAVVATGAGGVFGNPARAGLAGAAPSGVSLAAEVSGARPFGLRELHEGHAGLEWRLPRAALGVGARSFGSPAWAERELRVVGAWAASPDVALGAAVRALQARGAGTLAHRSVAVDLGMLARAGPGTRVGVTAEAALGDVPGDPAGRLRRTAVGARRSLAAGAVLHVEVERREDGPLGGAAGVAWTPMPELTLRGGIRERPERAGAGFTVRTAGLEVSAAATWTRPLGRTVRLGIRWFRDGGTDEAPSASRNRSSNRPPRRF